MKTVKTLMLILFMAIISAGGLVFIIILMNIFSVSTPRYADSDRVPCEIGTTSVPVADKVVFCLYTDKRVAADIPALHMFVVELIP